MAGGERFIEKTVRFVEPMETARETRAHVEHGCGIGRQRHRLGGDELRPVLVSDTTEHVTAQEQQPR